MIAASFALLALGACAKDIRFDETGGIVTTRSSCPAVGVPTYTESLTLFDPPQSRDARAIDLVATITDVRGACNDSGDRMGTGATFDVLARRTRPEGARTVTLPYFATVVRGGTIVVAKQLGSVTLHFADGQLRASTRASASADVSRAAATLPENVLKRLTRKRKASDADASIDPMSDPAVRAAVSKASFELLVGFQLTQDQLAYNATK